jgi:hypothetical protein
MHRTTQTTRRSRGARAGRAVALVVAGALPLVWSIAAVVAFVGGDDGGEHRFHDLTGVGVVLGVLWLGAVLGLARRGDRRPAALAQLLGIGVAATVATALAGESPVLPVIVLLPGLVLLALRADRAELRRLRPSPAIAALTIAAAVPLIPYAVGQAHLQAATHDAHASLEHYFDMAWIALAMPITAGVAALGIRGWRFAAGCAALAAAIFGVAAILFPGQESSPGAAWGAVAIVWAVTLAAATWLAEPAVEAAPAAA